MNTAKKIKAIRKSQKLTQKEVAEKMGTGQSSYAQYEIGRRIPRRETLDRIAAALGVDPAELYDDEMVSYTPLDMAESHDMQDYRRQLAESMTQPRTMTAALLKLWYVNRYDYDLFFALTDLERKELADKVNAVIDSFMLRTHKRTRDNP